MAEGWIKVYRKLAEKSFYRKDSEAVHLWIHLLFCANRSEREEYLGGKNITCNPGQFTTGRKQLSESTGINESKIERLLNKFEKIEQQIEQRKTTTNRLISILNWNEYQISNQESEQQVNNDRTTSEQRVNTLQEVKNIRSKEVKNKEEDLIREIDILPDFREPFKNWLQFKRLRGESYKDKQSTFLAYKKLLKLSNENPITANSIIEESMANNWAGLFPLKQEKKDGRPDTVVIHSYQ